MRYTILDLETAPHACVSEFVTPPDLSLITAAKNLKDPAKIEEDVRKRQEAATADYQMNLSRSALDWNLSRIVALAWMDESGLEDVAVCHDEHEEVRALVRFWQQVRQSHLLIGFRARTFDFPTLIQRSRLLGVKHPNVSLGRYGKGAVTDLYDLLTFDDARYEAIMPRSLKAFCKRFGIPVTDEIAGADIGQLVADGNWDDVVAHVTSDLRLTAELARLLGVVEPVRELVEEPFV